MEHEEFLKAVQEHYGDKVIAKALVADDMFLTKLNEAVTHRNEHEWLEGTPVRYKPYTKEALEAYGVHAWLKQSWCPECGAHLWGIFGTFRWGLVHGEGYCNDCKRIEFRFLHYVGEGMMPLQAFEIIGFKAGKKDG